jgi:hypothetical protein
METSKMNDTTSRLATLQAKSDFVVALGRYLADKSGPIRPENTVERLGLGLSYNDLSKSDQRVLIGTFGRLGWTRGKWPFWFRKSDDDAPEESHPVWLTRAA